MKVSFLTATLQSMPQDDEIEFVYVKGDQPYPDAMTITLSSRSKKLHYMGSARALRETLKNEEKK